MSIDVTRLTGARCARDPAVVAAYTVETEFALLAELLRSPVAAAEVAGMICADDFLEPCCARLWPLLASAYIGCIEISDDHLRHALADLEPPDLIEPIIDRLRHPLVRPKSVVKFAREVKRLARERRMAAQQTMAR